MTKSPAPGERRSVAAKGSAVVAFAIVASVVTLDQLTKELVLRHVSPGEEIRVVGPLRIVLRFNRGGAFSIGHGKATFAWLVLALVLALCVWFVRALRRRDPRLRGAALWAVSAMVGGSLGNIADRLFRSPGWNRGAVVDFVATGFWGVFNMADAALTVGSLTIAYLAVRRPGQYLGSEVEHDSA